MFRVLLSFIYFITSFAAYGQGFSRKAPVEYVIRIQEERRSTRWTLTEWLRIKERMKMMDVWLAMFSSKEDQARVAFNQRFLFNTRKLLFIMKILFLDSELFTQYQLKLWLTNIFTASTGLRLLNIDLGVEGGLSPFKENSGFTYFLRNESTTEE